MKVSFFFLFPASESKTLVLLKWFDWGCFIHAIAVKNWFIDTFKIKEALNDLNKNVKADGGRRRCQLMVAVASLYSLPQSSDPSSNPDLCSLFSLFLYDQSSWVTDWWRVHRKDTTGVGGALRPHRRAAVGRGGGREPSEMDPSQETGRQTRQRWWRRVCVRVCVWSGGGCGERPPVPLFQEADIPGS